MKKTCFFLGVFIFLVNNLQSQSPLLTRGPYLNVALQNSIILRWRTDIATDSKVSCGSTPSQLTAVFTDNTVTTEHIITVTGLTANTRYYYSIGSTSQILQGDVNNYFKTLPVSGSKQKTRFLAMGDMGTNFAVQKNVRDAWLTFNGSNYTDGWLLMGDNAYVNGTDAEYQINFFDVYQGSLTKNHVLWPSPGNHDYANTPARQVDHLIPYYSIFSVPINGEAGGIPSHNKGFYAYNYGSIHFVSLDSYGSDVGNRLYDTLGVQAQWLKQDLAANTLPWTVVYFHHPPYTKGSHNSDIETELVNMRERVVPIFERYKVDLVLSGHSHSYERSYLLNGHYGPENTFVAATHAMSGSNAKYDGSANSCTYIKNTSGARNGIVYAVVGSSGQVSGSTAGYPHDAMSYSDVINGGALYFEVEDNRLNAKWICGDGIVRDYFTIMKNVNMDTTITMGLGSDTVLTASWIGNYQWSTGATTRSILVSPVSDTSFSVTDGSGCITDQFNLELTKSSVSLCAPVAGVSVVASISGTVYQWQADAGNGFINITNNANYAGANTATLQLINIPSSWYGYKFHCIVDGNTSRVYQLRFVNRFTGFKSNVWNDVSNWSCGALPDANTDVLINSGNVVVNANATCRSIHTKPSATITILPAVRLTVTH